jgi:hypothetical protein
MKTPESPIPSDRFQDSLKVFEDVLKKGKFKDEQPPEWALMAAALESGFQILEKEGKLPLMFDTTNPFDLALLAWCVEARNRENRKREEALAQAPDPSRN